MVAVSNTSPISNLSITGRLDLLRPQFSHLPIPEGQCRSSGFFTRARSLTLWPQSNCAAGCCTIGQASAKARLYLRFSGESPFTSRARLFRRWPAPSLQDSLWSEEVHKRISSQCLAVMNWARCLGFVVAMTTSVGAAPNERACAAIRTSMSSAFDSAVGRPSCRDCAHSSAASRSASSESGR
jgi:hypothetical protein